MIKTADLERICHEAIQQESSLNGLAARLKISRMTLLRVRTGQIARGQPYKTEPRSNRRIHTKDFSLVRETAYQIKRMNSARRKWN